MEFNTTKNPWTRKSTQAIYENPWMKVIEDQVIRPNKSQGIYGHIHFKNKAIGVIPVDEALNTWLVGQYRYTLNEYSWEIPTGGVPHEEDSLEGAKRELREETGLIASRWKQILKIHTSNSVTDEYGYVYVASDLTQGETDWDETEQLQIRKIPLMEAHQLVMDNKITDSLSICGILKAVAILDV